MENDLGSPEITYPCRWEYKTIGTDEAAIRLAIRAILADDPAEYSLARSNTSRSGKYCSMVLELIVTSESHRNELFAALSNHPDIVMVL